MVDTVAVVHQTIKYLLHPMHAVAIIVIIGAIVIAVLNAFASYRVFKSNQLEPLQKTLQCILIWVVPLLGAGLCIALTREPKPRRGMHNNMTDSFASLDADPIFFRQSSGDYFLDQGDSNETP